jgi:hypothetical protein
MYYAVYSINIIAILVEAIWENLKMIWDKNKLNINMLGSLLLSMIICVLAQINIFKIVGIELIVPIIGYLLTGIIVSRGANFVNDLFSKLNNKEEK